MIGPCSETSRGDAKCSQNAFTEIARALNTALIASKANRATEVGQRYAELSQSAAFQAICQAIASLAESTGCTHQESAQKIIETFREMDALWDDYIYHEGITLLKKQLSGGS